MKKVTFAKIPADEAGAGGGAPPGKTVGTKGPQGGFIPPEEVK